jgi:hypothetical protein
MKNYFLLLILLFSGTAFATKKGPKTPEALGTALFKALKNQDQKAFVKLFTTDKDIESIIKDSYMSPAEKVRILERLKRESPFAKAPQEYFEVQGKAMDKGINWNNTKLLNVDFENRSENGLTMSKITVNFIESVTGKKYMLVVKDCPKTPSGWKIVDEVRLKNGPSGNNYEYNPDYNYPTEEQLHMMADSIRIADSLIMVESMYQQMMDTTRMEYPYEYTPEPDYCGMKVDSLRKALRLPAGQKCSKWI